MAKKTFTLIVVPDHNAPVRRYRVQKTLLTAGGRGVVLSRACPWRRRIHYFQVAKDAAENRILREENLALRSQLKSVRERIDHIGSTLDRVERFDQKLRAMTLLSDPQRNLAMGPTEPEPGATAPAAETQFTELTSRDARGAGGPAGQAVRRGHAPGAEPPGAAGLLPGPEVAARLDAVHLAGARLGDVRLRPAAGPVHRRSRDARRYGHRGAARQGSLRAVGRHGGVRGPGGRLRQRARHRPRLRHQDALRPPGEDAGEGGGPGEARRAGRARWATPAAPPARTSTTKCASTASRRTRASSSSRSTATASSGG